MMISARSVRRNLTTSAANEMYKSERHFGLDNTPVDEAFEQYQADHWKRSIDAAITRPMSYPACADGPCKQGRKVCPSPEACQLPERDVGPSRGGWGLVLAVLLVALILAVVFGARP